MEEYLVTGGTSFIASHVVKALLDLGHSVRTTVRDSSDEEKVRFLWELKGAKERLKIFEADLTVEGSFDEAVKGVDGVFHIASCVSVCLSIDDLVRHVSPLSLLFFYQPERVMHIKHSSMILKISFSNIISSPIVEIFGENLGSSVVDVYFPQEKLVERETSGTRNLMNSCEKSRNTVKRIVLTSSSSSVRYSYDATEASPLNESHWSDLDYCRRFKNWYGYAKTIGEKEAWKIAEEKKLNLVVVIPTFCIGPILSPKPTSSPSIILSIIKGVRGAYPNLRGGFVHIDDVVATQILAMEEPKASGRIICSSSMSHWSEVIEMLRTKYPLYPFETKCGGDEGRDMPHSLDTTKIRELGLPSFKSLAEMFDDCIKCFQNKGLL